LKNLCDEIDNVILNALPDKGIKFFGLCEIVKKGEQVFPVTIPDRKQASIIDNYNATVYHRLLSPMAGTEDPEFMFGATIPNRFKPRLRTFLAHKVTLGEDFIFTFANVIPHKLDLENYKFVDITGISVITDHEAIYEQEFGKTNYEKHRTSWNVYALEYDIEFIKC